MLAIDQHFTLQIFVNTAFIMIEAYEYGLKCHNCITIKGTVCWYQSRAITHYFTGSEIIMEQKICVILQYLLIKMACIIQSQVGRPQKYSGG